MRKLFLFMLSLLAAPGTADESAQSSRLSALLSEDGNAGFEYATAKRPFSFPQDHGPHEGYRNEWWYVTGNLDGEDGRRFGFELTIFRFSLKPTAPAMDSNWRTRQVYIAHLAVTDANGKRFHVAERYSRGAIGLAGAQAEPFRVWIDDWEMASGGADSPWRVRAADEQFGIDLTMVPLKKPVLNGDAGLSRKSSDIQSASYYYSIPRMQTEGTMSVGGRDFNVSGLSWLDREWSTSALAPDQVGWDWFALQLSDGTDLMLYKIRKADGSNDEYSSGTATLADGDSIALRPGDFEIRVEDRWKSPKGGVYPSRWTVSVPGQGLRLDITPVIADQELFTTVRYWEGAVDVAGERSGKPVSGRGYVELTGYAD